MQCSKTAPARALAGRGAPLLPTPRLRLLLLARLSPAAAATAAAAGCSCQVVKWVARAAARPQPPEAAPPLIPCQAHAGDSPLVLPEKKELRLVTPKYCESIHQTRRRPTRTIEV